jgi:hypothetical protein
MSSSSFNGGFNKLDDLAQFVFIPGLSGFHLFNLVSFNTHLCLFFVQSSISISRHTTGTTRKGLNRIAGV